MNNLQLQNMVCVKLICCMKLAEKFWRKCKIPKKILNNNPYTILNILCLISRLSEKASMQQVSLING